ncbi:MAG TPA: paraquat-inducible protein A [Solimonas sp.]
MSHVRSAAEMGLIRCHGCALTCADLPAPEGQRRHCPRCGVALRRRKANSLTRTWALLIAAALLYLPANLLPIMQTTQFFDAVDETILSGVLRLWRGGSYDLAIIVFVASIVVPLLKIGVLLVLLTGVQRGSSWSPRERAKLYRFVDFIGHWSMLDVFVVALLVGLVQFSGFALVLPGGGAVAFAAVVVLTMLASMSFDPRLIWDAPLLSDSEPSVNVRYD